jgi:hypothetical protein
MHVIRGVLRQVEVEDVTDIWDVQSTRCDVGSNQHGEIAVVKVAKELQSLVLRHIA